MAAAFGDVTNSYELRKNFFNMEMYLKNDGRGAEDIIRGKSEFMDFQALNLKQLLGTQHME